MGKELVAWQSDHLLEMLCSFDILSSLCNLLRAAEITTNTYVEGSSMSDQLCKRS